MYTKNTIPPSAGQGGGQLPTVPVNVGLGVAMAVVGGLLLAHQVYFLVMSVIQFVSFFEWMGGTENLTYIVGSVFNFIMYGFMMTSAIMLILAGIWAAMGKIAARSLLVSSIVQTVNQIYRIVASSFSVHNMLNLGFNLSSEEITDILLPIPFVLSVCIFTWVAFVIRKRKEKVTNFDSFHI